MNRVLIIGSYGLLGCSLSEWLSSAGHTVFRQGRNSYSEFQTDPTDASALRALFARCRPHVVINLAASTNVDLCEDCPHTAFMANVRILEAVSAAILACQDTFKAHLVHFSTDQVYDGPGLHSETNTNPCNVYGLSKYAGELVAARVGATVLRTNFVGFSHCLGRKSLSDWIVASLRVGNQITVFDDVLFSPLSIKTLCKHIEIVVDRQENGIFNLGSRNGMSKAQFAIKLAQSLNLDGSLLTIGSTKDVTLRARRPNDMRLDTTLLESTFGITMPSMDEEILVVAEEYRHVEV